VNANRTRRNHPVLFEATLRCSESWSVFSDLILYCDIRNGSVNIQRNSSSNASGKVNSNPMAICTTRDTLWGEACAAPKPNYDERQRNLTIDGFNSRYYAGTPIWRSPGQFRILCEDMIGA